MIQTKVKKYLDYYTYRCQYCGFECVGKTTPSGLAPTKLGNYGSEATPTPADLVSELYVASTISFIAESGSTPAKISDTRNFVDTIIPCGGSIRIATGSGTNDGDYTIANRGLSQGQILLSSTDSLTTENAATAGEVTISRLIKQPNITRGCAFCGSLNSKGD